VQTRACIERSAVGLIESYTDLSKGDKQVKALTIGLLGAVALAGFCVAPATASADTTTPQACPGMKGPNTDAYGDVVPCNDMGGVEKFYTLHQIGVLYDTADNVPLARIHIDSVTSTREVVSDNQVVLPEYGHFVTFTITVNDIAPAYTRDDISDSSDASFFIQTGKTSGARYGVDGGDYGIHQGNSWEAVQPNELGVSPSGADIDLLPGQTMKGTVVIDSPVQHGWLVDDDGGQMNGAWQF
jgi:hypothetical protein